NGRSMHRCLHLADGAVTLEPAHSPARLSINDTDLVNTFGPSYRMLLIGAGHLAGYLATMALFSGFDVSLCDPREEYTRNWSLEGVRLLTGMPDDVVRDFRPDNRSCVLAL